MRHLQIAALIGSIAVAPLALAAPAGAQDLGDILGGAAAVGAGIAGAPFLWGGRNYCWYPGGWRGPGWYWCGYGARYGYGWGGPAGWHGWYYGRPGGYGRGRMHHHYHHMHGGPHH